MSKSRKPKVLPSLTALVLITELGLAVAVPIVVGVVAGKYLDDAAGGHGILLTAFILLGIVAGIYSAYRVLTSVMGTKS